MLQSQFAGIQELPEGETGEQRLKSRSYQIRIKQRRSELEDYDLSTYFIHSEETIGEGGFGKVRKATHRPTGETVAVKICSPSQDDDQTLGTILREIELQRNLLHENVAQIYEVIRKDNRIYIFMEYCRNGELFDRINRSGPFPEREAARIFHQLLSALLYLRNSGVSHRDIKPENVLFDQQWNVKLIDFGFSCPANGDFRRTVCGTPSYTPPEIIRKVKYDPELVDVWCLGVTLYAMLGAQLPFEGDTNDKRKANIVACKFEQKPIFTPRAQKLFSWIFVDAKYRPKLSDLLTCEFSLNYEPPTPFFIDFKTENPVSEQAVMEILQKELHMDRKRVADSVSNCRLDRYRATYYLTLRSMRNTQKYGVMNQFKKQRKNSVIKLQPISRTPTPTKKDALSEKDTLVLALKTSRFDKDAVFAQRPRVSIDPNSARLRKNSLDSPRRLLDCLAAYKGF